jgi:hypothetical protein
MTYNAAVLLDRLEEVCPEDSVLPTMARLDGGRSRWVMRCYLYYDSDVAQYDLHVGDQRFALGFSDRDRHEIFAAAAQHELGWNVEKRWV